MAPKKQVVTNAEGIEIRKPSGKMDRIKFILLAVLQLVAVGIIVHQLKALGILPQWINTDLTTFGKFLPRNPIIVPPCGHVRTRNVLITSSRIVFPDGVSAGGVHIKRTKIQAVYKGKDVHTGALDHAAETVKSLGGEVLDFGSLVVAPGVVDVHVHFNEPGRMHWEGIVRGSSAAAAGGVTAVTDMPLNCNPPITTAARLDNKLTKVWMKSRVGMSLWGGLVPENAYDHKELEYMLKRGIVGFKAFMANSGLPDFQKVGRRELEAVLPLLIKHDSVLMVHAEVESDAGEVCGNWCDVRSHASWAASRPERFEVAAAEDVVASLKHTRSAFPDLWGNATAPGSRFKVHVAHVASPEAVKVYAQAREESLPITVEVSPHHLLFAAEDVPDGATEFKCAPPLRPRAVRDALVEALAAGDIDFVASDHSPTALSMKERTTGDFMKAWGGVAGVQYTLPAMNTLAVQHGWSLSRLTAWLSSNPANMLGLSNRKGFLLPGYDADVVIWDPEAPANTSRAACLHANKLTPYADAALKGKVTATFVEGAMVFSADKGVHEANCGAAVLLK